MFCEKIRIKQGLSYIYIILFLKDTLRQKIDFNGNFFGNKCCPSRKKCLYKFDPIKPHFYIVKLGFIGVYIFFLISAQKLRLWVLIRQVRTASARRF